MSRTPLIEKILRNIQNNKNLINNLLNDHERGKVEGESLYIDDALKAPMQLMTLANTTQKSRAGYNKLRIANTNKTINGIDYIVNEDGTVIANGTATEISIFPLNSEGVSSIKPDVLKAGTYSVVDFVGDYTNYFTQISCIDDEGNTYFMNSGSSVVSINLPNDVNFGAWIYVRKGVTVNNLVFKPMLLEGTFTMETSPEYEQYGSMPSSRFPSPIKSVSGSYAINHINKNLLPNNLLTQEISGTILKVHEDKTFTWKGITNSNNYGNKYFVGKVPLKEILDKPVTLSRGYIKKDNNIGSIVSKIANSEGVVMKENAFNLDTNDNLGWLTTTFKSCDWKEYQDLYLEVYLYNQGLPNVSVDIEGYVQLEYGENATQYVKYQSKDLNLDFPEGVELNHLGEISDEIEFNYTEVSGYKKIDRNSVKWIRNTYLERITDMSISDIDGSYKRFYKYLPTISKNASTSENVAYMNRYKLGEKGETFNKNTCFTIAER